LTQSEEGTKRSSTDPTPFGAATSEMLPPPTKTFILRRLWNGELSLPVTYWAWGVGGSFLVGLALGKTNFASTFAEILIIDGLILAWMIFITVCIFARARAYSRQYPTRHWGTVAKIFAGLSLLGGLANLAKSLPGNESTQDLDMLVTAANKSVRVRLQRMFA
jgi:hypothetical protein